jgi:CMP-N-acetylneuraminic acid synthetase
MREITQGKGESLMTVVETRSNLGRLENGRFRPLVPGAPRRRQAREPFYIESSTVYICRTDHLRRNGSLVSQDWMAVKITEAEALDINTEADLRLAEYVHQRS